MVAGALIFVWHLRWGWLARGLYLFEVAKRWF